MTHTDEHKPRLLAGLTVALTMFGVILNSTIPSGLYAIYQREMGLPESVTTMIFSIYGVSVVVALLFGGHLSDQVGRKPIILLSTALGVASAAVFFFATNEYHLYAGRFMVGMSVGLCTGAFTAALRELIGARSGALVSTILTSLALAVGPLFSAVQAQFADSPLRTPFQVYGALTTMLLVACLFLPESRPKHLRPAGRISLSPRAGVDPSIRRLFLPAAVAIGCAYGTNGLFQSVVPLAIEDIGVPSQMVMALVTAVMLAVSAVTQLATMNSLTRRSLSQGLLILAFGLVGTAAALAVGSLGLFWMFTVVVGVGQGITFRASLARASDIAPPAQMSQTVSAYYVVGYLVSSVPPLVSTFAGGSGTLPVVCAVIAVVCVVNIGLAKRSLGRKSGAI